MSQIIKTEAVVIGKMNYSDSSIIATLFTESSGKVSAIIKGARSPKSKLSRVVDVLNRIEVIFYKKQTRELQIVSSADLISHYEKIKSDLESAKYSVATLELIKNLTVEDEPNKRLYRGLIKILEHFENQKEKPSVLFARFFMFIITETGYEMLLEKCGICSKEILSDKNVGYNFSTGFICNDCLSSHSGFETIKPELFKFLFALKSKQLFKSISDKIVDEGNSFMIKYVKEHIPDFRGIQSLSLY